MTIDIRSIVTTISKNMASSFERNNENNVLVITDHDGISISYLGNKTTYFKFFEKTTPYFKFFEKTTCFKLFEKTTTEKYQYKRLYFKTSINQLKTVMESGLTGYTMIDGSIHFYNGTDTLTLAPIHDDDLLFDFKRLKNVLNEFNISNDTLVHVSKRLPLKDIIYNSIDTNNPKDELNGLLIDFRGDRIVSCDARKLAIQSELFILNISSILIRKEALIKGEDFFIESINQSRTKVKLSINGISIISELIQKTYFDIDRLIPKNIYNVNKAIDSKFDISLPDLLKLKLKNEPYKFTVENNIITINHVVDSYSKTISNHAQYLSCTYVGEKLEFMVNGVHLKAFGKDHGCLNVTYYEVQNSPLLIKPSCSGLSVIINTDLM